MTYSICGDGMKKFRPIVLAILVGISCAYFLFNDIEGRTYDSGNIKALQIGVFKRKDSALNMAKNYGGIVLKDKDVYRVYLAILKNKSNIDFIENYLDDKGISYYIKDMYIDDEYIEKGNVIERVMDESDDYNIKIKTNKEILEYYEGVL